MKTVGHICTIIILQGSAAEISGGSKDHGSRNGGVRRFIPNGFISGVYDCDLGVVDWDSDLAMSFFQKIFHESKIGSELSIKQFFIKVIMWHWKHKLKQFWTMENKVCMYGCHPIHGWSQTEAYWVVEPTPKQTLSFWQQHKPSGY